MSDALLIPGTAEGPLLRLEAPLSFWGGVDPASGRIIQVRHPQYGKNIAGTVLALPGTIGSSSSSAVMLELIRGGNAPAALLLAAPDAILLLGCVVAREMGWAPPPALRLDGVKIENLQSGRYLVDSNGLCFRGA